MTKSLTISDESHKLLKIFAANEGISLDAAVGLAVARATDKAGTTTKPPSSFSSRSGRTPTDISHKKNLNKLTGGVKAVPCQDSTK